MRERARKPAAFSLDDPALVVTPREEARGLPADVAMSDAAQQPRPSGRARSRLPWAAIFWISSGGLVLLAIGLGIADLINGLLSRAAWLGGLGLALTALAGLALAAIVIREAAGLIRLAEIDRLRSRAAVALAGDDRPAARAIGRELVALTRRMPHLAKPRARFQRHLDDIIDGGDLVRLAERELMAPLDAEARRLIGAAARRVSLVTALTPRAAIDMVFVLVTALVLVRQLALLYGGRPGMLGLGKLMRYAIVHLAATGGIAASDSLIQQVIGHGLAAKLSARLGEGVVNGLLTARLGLAALNATRPLPYVALRRPTLNDIAGTLLTGARPRGAEQALTDQSKG